MGLNQKIKLFLTVLVLSSALVFLSFKAKGLADFRSFGKILDHRIAFSVKLDDTFVAEGAVLGPIAADMRTQNQRMDSPLRNIFKKLNTLDEAVRSGANVDGLLRDLRNTFLEQADILDAEADDWANVYSTVENGAYGLALGRAQFADHILDAGMVIRAKRQVADNLRKSSNTMSHNEIIDLAGKNIVKESLGEGNHIVFYDSSLDVDAFFDPSVIALLNADHIQNDDQVFKILAKEELKNRGAYDNLSAEEVDNLGTKIAVEMKNIRQDDPDRLLDDFNKELGLLVRRELDGYAEGRSSGDMDGMAGQTFSDDYIAGAGVQPCTSGYAKGIAGFEQCAQMDCELIAGAVYDEEGNCICGNSESGMSLIACERTEEYSECPKCLFACVAIGSSCPPTE